VTGMEERTRVTVVIPCFDQARYLPAAVASVRAQTCGPVACVVVDDGSTDDTAAVASQLGTTVLRQANAGVSAARNAGLAAARSDLVVFLDADDMLLPDAVAVEVGRGQLREHEVALAVGVLERVEVDGQPVGVLAVDPRADGGSADERAGVVPVAGGCCVEL